MEPFCGGLAVSLGLQPAKALLGDANPHLISFYQWLKRGLAITMPFENKEKPYYRHRRRFNELMHTALSPFVGSAGDAPDSPPSEDRRIKVAIVGRPNVGKSTLINALLGEQRLITFDQPGTTRDSIEIDFDFDGRAFTLIDTAGLRRRGKVFETVEKFSVVKTLQSIADSNVVILVLDASSEIADQDAHKPGTR